ncbi:chain-length determining protein [Pseudomonas brassicacearum]|uniref:Chain-length determining protein n=2 Tax=Pseudomonas brassicacearum TaxID=930166 RepID=A0A423H3H6_9PSED|nr:chain-length determining protein [Pseudomonas brassicacearum]
MQNNSTTSPSAAEVDLRVLMSALWRQRVVIVASVVVVTIFATAYAFLSTPIYEAKAIVIPPTQNDIANYNYGRTSENELTPFTVKDVYSIFLRNLQAESLRRDFFNNVYLPALPEVERKKIQGTLYDDFLKKVAVSVVGKDSPDRYSVTVDSEQPEQAVAWINEYINRASELAKKEMIKDISGESGVLARNIYQQITSVREVGLKVREDTITRLREALVVAEAIGLESPPIISGNSAEEVAGSLEGLPIYMRGAKALKAEISNLENRKSEDPFINRLRVLQAKYNFYTGLEANILNVAVFRVDGVVERPDHPVKPQKALTLLLGLVLGLALGVVIALIRIFFASQGKESQDVQRQ